MFSLIYILILPLLAVNEVSGIRCYVCSSHSHRECLEPNNSQILTTHCSLYSLKQTKHYAEEIYKYFDELFDLDAMQNYKEPMVVHNCYKQVTKVGDEEFILRGCHVQPTVELDLCRDLKEMDSDNLHTTYCSLCNYDGCNSALNINNPISIVVICCCLLLLL